MDNMKQMQGNKEGLELLKIGIKRASYNGKVVVVLDIVSSEIYTEKDQRYDLNFKQENNNGGQKISISVPMNFKHIWACMRKRKLQEKVSILSLKYDQVRPFVSRQDIAH